MAVVSSKENFEKMVFIVNRTEFKDIFKEKVFDVEGEESLSADI